MKIYAGKNPQTAKFMHDDGTEIKDLCATAVTIELEVEQPTRAIIELLHIDATVEVDKPNYIVGKHKNVRGVVLEDGRIEYFPGFEYLKNERWPDLNLPGPLPLTQRQEICTVCDGRGQYLSEIGMDTCRTCKGAGVIRGR